MSLDIARLRQDFPFFAGHPDLVYLDSAASAQKPEAMLAALDRFHRQGYADVHRAGYRLAAEATTAFEAARETVARFLNAPGADTIVWTRGSTEAVNLVAQSFGRSQLRAGDVILLSELEHHANIVPWQLLAEAVGAELRVLPIRDDGALDDDAFDRCFDGRVRLVAVTALSNALGTRTPLPELVRRARAVGAAILVDAAQSVVHDAIDVQALDCDFLVFSGHKLYGPTGIGVLYGKRERLAQMPPWQGGGEMIERVSFSGTRFQPPPLRFEAGTPDIAGAIGLAAAIDYLNGLDRAALARHEAGLLASLEVGLDSLPGLRRLSRAPDRAALAAFVVDGQHPSDTAHWLDGHGIAVRAGHHCAMPLMQRLGVAGSVRASFGLYSSAADVERLLTALAALAAPTQVPIASAAIPASDAPDESPVLERLRTARGWEARYRALMQLGKDLPELPEELRRDEALVPGCESPVWLWVDKDESGRFRLRADSDARILRGLLALVLTLFDGKTAEAIRSAPVAAVFEELELSKHLSPSRSNGLAAIVRRLQALAD